LTRHTPEDCKDWNDRLLGKTIEPWEHQDQSAKLWQWYAIANPAERKQAIAIGLEFHAARNPRALTPGKVEIISVALGLAPAIATPEVPIIDQPEPSALHIEQPTLFTLESYEAIINPVVADPTWAELPTSQHEAKTNEAPQPELNQPSLQDLRDWYRQAKDIGRSERHLRKIEQVGKAFREGQWLEPQDLQAQAKDQTLWKQQAQAIANHAKTILETVGRSSASGTLFEGKRNYTLFAQQDTLYVLATGRGILPTGDDRTALPDRVLQSRRGIILKLHQGEISTTATRITATDAKRFEQFVNLVRSQELQVVGCDVVTGK
jgi:hypothetical protein